MKQVLRKQFVGIRESVVCCCCYGEGVVVDVVDVVVSMWCDDLALRMLCGML